MNKHSPRPVVYDPPDLKAAFAHIDTWVFDLDNTLYPFHSDLWPQIDERITLYLADRMGLDALSARALQMHYYRRFGTTLCGLVTEDGVAAEEFLSFVHDIDRSSLAPHPELGQEIRALPGRKLIFTNGSRDHALKTATQLGFHDAFEGMFDIVDSNLIPKTGAAAYEAFFARFAVDPQRAAMFEDVARNLTVPRAVGMTSILVVPGDGHLDHRDAHDKGPGDQKAADFTTSDLAAFLGSVNALFR